MVSAISSDNHPGMVEVTTRVRSAKDAPDGHYLVHEDEYDGAGRFGFVVDPARYPLRDNPGPGGGPEAEQP